MYLQYQYLKTIFEIEFQFMIMKTTFKVKAEKKTTELHSMSLIICSHYRSIWATNITGPERFQTWFQTFLFFSIIFMLADDQAPYFLPQIEEGFWKPQVYYCCLCSYGTKGGGRFCSLAIGTYHHHYIHIQSSTLLCMYMQLQELHSNAHSVDLAAIQL